MFGLYSLLLRYVSFLLHVPGLYSILYKNNFVEGQKKFSRFFSQIHVGKINTIMCTRYKHSLSYFPKKVFLKHYTNEQWCSSNKRSIICCHISINHWTEFLFVSCFPKLYFEKDRLRYTFEFRSLFTRHIVRGRTIWLYCGQG